MTTTTRPMMTNGLAIGDRVTVTALPSAWHIGRVGTVRRFILDGDIAEVDYAMIGHTFSGDPFAYDHDLIVTLKVPTNILVRV